MEYDRFRIEGFGLTEREAYLIIAVLNGILLTDAPTTSELATSVLAAADSSFQDHAAFGFDLSIIEGDTPETPHALLDLAEKISKLPDWQALAIAYYVAGFWEGIGEVSRPRG
jgi:hypothetical protein